MASSEWTLPVDLRTFGRIANPPQNRCLPCIRSSNNEHSELDIWESESGETLLRSHIPNGCRKKDWRGEGDDQTLDCAGTLCHTSNFSANIS